MLAKGDLGDESGRKDEIKDKERGAVPAANQAGYNILHFQTTTSKQRLLGVERQVAFRNIFWALTSCGGGKDCLSIDRPTHKHTAEKSLGKD